MPETDAERAGCERAVHVDLDPVAALEARALGEARVEAGSRLDEPPLEPEGPKGADRVVERVAGHEDVDVAERAQRRVGVHRVRQHGALQRPVLDAVPVEYRRGVDEGALEAQVERELLAVPRGEVVEPGARERQVTVAGRGDREPGEALAADVLEELGFERTLERSDGRVARVERRRRDAAQSVA